MSARYLARPACLRGALAWAERKSAYWYVERYLVIFSPDMRPRVPRSFSQLVAKPSLPLIASLTNHSLFLHLALGHQPLVRHTGSWMWGGERKAVCSRSRP
eukprot:scaffold112868_cov31-Tisochrysis_lutea.AAC.9